MDYQQEISRTDLEKIADFLPYPFIIAEDFGDKHLNTYLNEKFLEEIGYTLDEIPTIDLWYFNAYPDAAYRSVVIANWNEAEQNAQEQDKVFVKMKSQVTCKNGTKRWYEIKASVISKIHVVAFVDLDKEINLQDELKKINRNNDRMLSILGHDLRSPVANLMTLSSMAATADISSDEFVSLIDQINIKSTQMLELLDTTLNWARLNFNTITQQHIPVDLEEVLRNTLEIYKIPYEAKGIAVSVSPQNARVIESDPEIVTIIVRNIISNAIKFTPQNGSINIHIRENETVISDDGIGMTAAMIDEVLNSSYSSRRGTNNEIGIGMGMQLVKSLTEKIRCHMSIDSETGKGTTIRLVFN